jgi:predicted CoA-binding protein
MRGPGRRGGRDRAKGFWQQLRIVNIAAAELAKKAGLVAVVDLCFKMETAAIPAASTRRA